MSVRWQYNRLAVGKDNHIVLRLPCQFLAELLLLLLLLRVWWP